MRGTNMTNTKHTPAPWEAGRPDMATIVEGFESKYIYSGNNVVAISYGMSIPKWDEVMANARLIAAAPELLEALEIITQRAQGCLPATSNLEDHPLWQAIINANKAIQKARGE